MSAENSPLENSAACWLLQARGVPVGTLTYDPDEQAFALQVGQPDGTLQMRAALYVTEAPSVSVECPPAGVLFWAQVQLGIGQHHMAGEGSPS